MSRRPPPAAGRASSSPPVPPADAPAPGGTEVEARREVRGMASGSGINLLGAAISQVAAFGIVFVLARGLGEQGVGLYAQAYALLSLLNVLACSGLRSGLTRFVAVHRADGDEAALRGTIRLGLGFAALAAALLGAALYAAAPLLVRHFFDDPRLLAPIRFVAVALVCQSVTDSALSATQGFRTMRYFAGIGFVVEPVLRIALTGALLLAGWGIRGAMTALVVSNLVAAVLALLALRSLLGTSPVRPAYDPRRLFGFSMVSWLGSLATTGLIWTDTLMLGAMRGSAEVGVYNVATRLIVLATFVMPPINAAFAPRIADLYHRGRMDALQQVYATATGWIVRLSAPGFIALVVLPGDLLRLFGPAFAVGAGCTAILAVGKLVDAATGPCSLMLNMSEHPLANTANNVAVLVLNVGLNLYLIPRHGIVGAAVAWALSLWLVNTARVLQVWRIMGMLPFGGLAKALLAAGAALAGTALAAQVVGPPWRLPLGLATLAVVYVGVTAMLGLSAEDREVGRLLRDRVRGSRRRSTVPA